jgi:hypothetical protein
MVATEPLWEQEKLQRRYFTASKFFFVVTMIYLLFIALLIIGVYFLQLGNKWAILTIEQWILSAIALLSIVIGLEVVFLLHYTLEQKKHLRPEKPAGPVFLQGKEVFTFSVPQDVKGGIFSKTYILIDENRILHLRYQMIPPKDLWGPPQ